MCDESGDGYVRSDGCVVVFMQKTSQARRAYATILNICTDADNKNDCEKTEYDLMRATCDEIGLNPTVVSYVEIGGIGIKAGDTQEVNEIADVYCEDREQPLLIGSVKSNMGHSEAAAGVCAIAKVLLAMEAGEIPANLHFNVPNSDLHGILDGRMKVVEHNTPWLGGGVAAVNAFGDVNVHVLLKSNAKPKLARASNDRIPRLAVASGRTSDAVDSLLQECIKNYTDDEYLGLVNGIYVKPSPLHPYRGFSLAGETIKTMSEIRNVDCKREIWYIYSGMGSQWASMARGLIGMNVFRHTIERCAAVLPNDINLVELLTRSEESTFDNVLNSFVAITAVQIGLTDVLTQFGIRPDGIVGHSTGEFCSGYGDGGLTAEQAILVAYWQGRCILDTEREEGMMAAVGLSWHDTKVKLVCSFQVFVCSYERIFCF